MTGKETPKEKAWNLLFPTGVKNKSIKDRIDSALLAAKSVIETLTYINAIPDGPLHQILQYWRQVYTEILEVKPEDYVDPVVKQESKEEELEKVIKSRRRLSEAIHGIRYDPRYAVFYPDLKPYCIEGIDPASDTYNPSSIAIRSPEGSVERVFLQSKEQEDVEDYFISGAKSINDEDLIEEMRKMPDHYNSFPRGIQLEGFVDWDLRIRVDNLRKKSELNVIKYRRK